jgi:hypothetical protein
MNTQDILSTIDAEISRLQAARSFLAGTAGCAIREPFQRSERHGLTLRREDLLLLDAALHPVCAWPGKKVKTAAAKAMN